MPKKSKPETPEEQSERFRREAQKLIDAGELNPEEGKSALERIVAKPFSVPKADNRNR
jgi:hypothetical protein